jgi:HD-GYP domain-containing protein (c-di-GMP phosphodiesterase class II)
MQATSRPADDLSAMAKPCHGLVLTLHQLAESLGRAVDAKDAWTCAHSEEVAVVGQILALNLGFSPSQAEMVHLAGHLHDIGKIGIPDAILQKPDVLTRQELELIKRHPVIGEAIVQPVKVLGGHDGVARMIRHHHERYDGSGYPDGLAGRAIPLGARILAVADSLSAMMQERPYKAAMSYTHAEAEILAQAGRMYDPRVVEAFQRGRRQVLSWLAGVREETRSGLQERGGRPSAPSLPFSGQLRSRPQV